MTIRIGNAQGFWGDATDAPARLLAQQPDLDVLTLDYLAEVSMSILARLREKESDAGYAQDFVEVVRSLAPLWRDGSKLRLVTNAGGLNPRACAGACAAALRAAGVSNLRIGVVSGDDVLPLLTRSPERFNHLETDQSLEPVADRLVTANAYLGAEPVVRALQQGATIVITGRVADPSLAVAPCVHRFGWSMDDYDRLAGATVAGHLIECGTQVTGGISTGWMGLADPVGIGFPVVEITDDGSCVVTKPAGTGGAVTEMTVKEQLLYEIGDPGRYVSPDATVSFLGLKVQDLGSDRVRVSGARGGRTTDSYKVSATYRAGWRASGSLTIIGRDAVAKARRAGQVVLQRLERAGLKPQHARVECLGAGDACPVLPRRDDLFETVLRIGVMDERRQVVERFSRELVPLVTSGPQGTTGYFDGRPTVREVFGYWPCLVKRQQVRIVVDVEPV